MSDEELNQTGPDPPAEPITEEPAAPPPVTAPKQWKMPEPIFRKTSGYLPQGFEKRYGPINKAEPADPAAQPDVDFGAITMVGGSMPKPSMEPPAPVQPAAPVPVQPPTASAPVQPPTAPSASAAAPPHAAAVEPQPEISESFALDDLENGRPPAAPQKRSGAFRIVLLILGLLAIFAFAAVFLAVIYILFFAPQSDTGNF